MSEFMPNKMVKAGEVVFREGDLPEEGIFYICHGDVQISRNEPTGERALATLGVGAVFGEMGIINSAPRNATVTALTDCGFFTINQQNFQHRVNQLDPLMRGTFRVFVLTIRDFLAHHQELVGQLQVIMQHMQSMPTASEESDDEPARLTDGAVRKMHY